jgi:hypothetical protein
MYKHLEKQRKKNKIKRERREIRRKRKKQLEKKTSRFFFGELWEMLYM